MVSRAPHDAERARFRLPDRPAWLSVRPVVALAAACRDTVVAGGRRRAVSLLLRLRPLMPLLLLLALWQLAAMRALPADRMPVPADVIATGWRLIVSGEVPLALLQSLARVL